MRVCLHRGKKEGTKVIQKIVSLIWNLGQLLWGIAMVVFMLIILVSAPSAKGDVTMPGGDVFAFSIVKYSFVLMFVGGAFTVIFLANGIKGVKGLLRWR